MSNNGDSGYNRKFEKLVGKAWPDSGKSRESVFGPTDDSPSSQDPAMNDFVADVWDIIDELGNLLISKQRDYGPGNINNAFCGPMSGLLVRIGDKFERLKNLFIFGDGKPQHEPIEDSFKDLANYAIIAMMVQRGKWPKNKL